MSTAAVERRAFVQAEAEILKSYRRDFAAAIKARWVCGVDRIISIPSTVTIELTEDVAPLRGVFDVHDGSISATFLLSLVSISPDGDGVYSVEQIES